MAAGLQEKETVSRPAKPVRYFPPPKRYRLRNVFPKVTPIDVVPGHHTATRQGSGFKAVELSM